MTEKLRINDIELDGGTQARAGLNDATVAEYEALVAEAQAAGQDTGETIWPFKDPVEVYYDGSAYWLADGFHRVAACRRAGRYIVEANVHQGTRREAILHAAGANAEHGLRRTHDDKGRAVRRLLEDEEWGKWSDREIARICKVSHPFVGGQRRQLTGNVTSERVYRDRHGNEAVMKTANIGKTAVPTDDDFDADPPPPRLDVWALERHVSAWLDSSGPASCGFIGDKLDVLRAIKEKKVGYRVPFDNIKNIIGLANYTDNDLRQAINNVLDQMVRARGSIRAVSRISVPNREQTAVPDPLDLDEIDAIHDAEIAEMLMPPATATAVETATHWLRHYVDPVHNRIWTDLDDTQVHHANSPCCQAFKKQHPAIGDHKALLKAALANLKRERAGQFAESVKSLWDATLRLVAQCSNQECMFELNEAARALDRALTRLKQETAVFAVSEEVL